MLTMSDIILTSVSDIPNTSLWSAGTDAWVIIALKINQQKIHDFNELSFHSQVNIFSANHSNSLC